MRPAVTSTSRAHGPSTGAASGWTPRFLVADDGGRTLALTRSWPVARRVAARTCHAGRSRSRPTGALLGARLAAIGSALADGRTSTSSPPTPRCPPRTPPIARPSRRPGSTPIEEIQPSRHRVTLPLAGRRRGRRSSPGSRSRPASGSGRPRSWASASFATTPRRRTGGPGDGFVGPSEPPEPALDRFYDLLLETGERRHFTFGPREAFVGWWTAALAAGHLVYLEARGSGDGASLAGLILYRHGGRLSTVHSGDHAAARRDHPGRAPPAALAGDRARDPRRLLGDGPRWRGHRGRPRRTEGRRRPVRPVSAQDLVRRTLARADRCARARLRSAAATGWGGSRTAMARTISR